MIDLRGTEVIDQRGTEVIDVMQLRLLEIDQVLDSEAVCQKWDDLLKQSPSSGFMQSTAWAAFRLKRNYRVFHKLLFQGDELVGGGIGYAPVVAHGAGNGVEIESHGYGEDLVTGRRTASRPTSGLWGVTDGASILSYPDGPVIPWHNPALGGEAMRLLVQSAKQESERENFLAIRMEPRISAPVPSALRLFKRAPVDSLPAETLYIDLALPESELFQSFHPKCRYNLRLAAKSGVTLREATCIGAEGLTPDRVQGANKALAKFYSILSEAGQRDDFFVEPQDFFEDLFSTLPPGMIRLFFAEHDGDVLATAAVVIFGARATYLYGAVSNAKRNLMAGYALQWHVMCAAKESGCSEYDFYGFVSPALTEHPHAQFSRFKQQFGGKPQRFIGAHDYYFVDNLASLVVKALTEVSSIFSAPEPNDSH